jgi:argininosuccinate lyase
VQNLKLPFRQAHHAAGQLVALAEKKGVPLEQLALAEMRRIEPRITDAIFGVLSLERSVASRKSEGGTAPECVRGQAAEWRKRLASEESKP